MSSVAVIVAVLLAVAIVCVVIAIFCVLRKKSGQAQKDTKQMALNSPINI